MATYAASDVTYTVKNLRTLGNSKKHNRIQLVFGDGALTYAAGGVPVTIAKLGCPNVVESMTIVSKSTSGYVFTYNPTSAKILAQRCNATANSNPLVEAVGDALAATTLEVEIIGW